MKIGTFVLGGLAGAALVMVMQRNGRLSAMAGSVGQQMRSRMGGMKEDAIGKMLNMRFGGSRSSSGGDASASRRNNASDAAKSGGLDEIAHLASQDSEVQQQVNEILDQNGQHRI
ncbi:hypothetical protein J19TS2_12730 [Cohnella xylanilytica]|uniref:Uncharacterized protein n=1 Tax=Cohnella xylanilytica TaxID=557555 RepID=A0A841TP82_9BACL|nr:hypothetical protein [Cohnella xylanilytica]MBB6690136.1 hypothetical protein [Cohnella xylanilytica]GIO11718.1 hypothetical protein J19TS2_12730 [Cohnella xylanilytica]